MKQYSSKSVPSRKNSLPKRVAVPAFAVALLLMAGGPVYADATPTPTPMLLGSNPTLSPLAVAVNTAQAAVNDARSKVSAAEKASKASPTDNTLKAALDTARANYQTAMAALKAAQDAYVADAKKNITSAQATLTAAQATLKDARAKLDALRVTLQPALKAAMDAAVAKAKNDAGVVTPDAAAVASAKALLSSTYATWNDARSKVSAAEKASKANPSDTAAVQALNDARTAASAAGNAYNLARNAFAKLVGDNGQPKPTVKIDTKALATTVQAAFLAAHPDLAAAQKAVSDAESAVKAAQAALNGLRNSTKDMGHKAINGNNPSTVSGQMGINVPGAPQGNFGEMQPSQNSTNHSEVHMTPPSTETHRVNTPAVTAALAAVADAKAKVSAAESASKASPTDNTLKAALDTARANLQLAMTTLATAEAAQGNTPNPTPSIHS